MKAYKNRIEKLCDWMEKENIDAVFIEDAETRRSKNLQYLSGMDSDALLVIFSDASTVLIPWDIIMAEKTAAADKIIPYAEFERNAVKALKSICSSKLSSGRIELSSRTPYLLYTEITAELKGFEIVCRDDGVSEKLLEMRSIKDEAEIALYRKAGIMTNKLIDALEAGFSSGSIKTEIDAAMLIEAESRRLGAEGPSFETLAAGPTRSWGIHCIPAYSAGPIGGILETGGGLSIIDCGLKLDGYATDITMTVCRGKLSEKQEQMVELVKEAHSIAFKTAEPGISAAGIAEAVDCFFSTNGRTMPHSLGHGIGLDVHEAPILKNHQLYNKPMLPGMIFTIEPGLYDAEAGGVRYEDDFLITETGVEKLTSSRILRLQ